jgi:predicted alpha/beta-fold hydrolase
MTDEKTDKRVIESNFKPAWWLRHRHLQTIWPSMPWAWKHIPKLDRRELELPDGDVTAVDWVVEERELPREAPTLVILHGLESSAESAYARMLMHAASALGWRCCVLHFRDCGDYRNRLPRRYHAGETNDIRHFLGTIIDESGPLIAAGYSMKESVRQKFDLHTAAFDWNRVMEATNFLEFDDAITAPLHGFAGVDDYYGTCSSGQFLDRIGVPTLVVNALDDPFMTPDVIPAPDKLSEHVQIEVSTHGGHVGFVEGGTPWRPRYYLPRRVTEFLSEQL